MIIVFNHDERRKITDVEAAKDEARDEQQASIVCDLFFEDVSEKF